MNEQELNLLLRLSRIRKETKNTSEEKLFVRFLEKLNSEPNILHKLVSIRTIE